MAKQVVACQVCRLPLNSVSPAPPDDPSDEIEIQGIQWLHPFGGPDDHDPVPVWVPYQDVVSKCDFCAALEVSWVYPCASFRVEFVADALENPVAGHGSSGDWAACEACHELIEAQEWDRLVGRSVDSYGHLPLLGASKNEVRRLVAGFHRQFRLHRTGPAYRLYE